jgi:hypothetical protein
MRFTLSRLGSGPRWRVARPTRRAEKFESLAQELSASGPEVIAFAVSRPRRVALNEIFIRPSKQA